MSLRHILACTAVFAMAALPVQGQDDVSRADLEALEAEREETLRQLAILESAGGVVAQTVEDTPLDRLTRQDERTGWESIGRVDVRRGGFCTDGCFPLCRIPGAGRRRPGLA